MCYFQKNNVMENEIEKTEQQSVMVVSNVETLEALNRSEIDMQISTAKKYPRNITNVLSTIETLATLDKDVAASCFYSLPRDGKTISGPSVRMAEIVASAWGNLRVQARIISNDGKIITAQGVCHDLEKNVATSVEVKRKITNKYGKTFSEDMQVVTGNAACAIAMRNALFKVVPAAYIKKVLDKAKSLSVGDGKEFEQVRIDTINWFANKGVTPKKLFEFLSVKSEKDITAEMVADLRGVATAVSEGTSTIDEIFASRYDEEKAKEVKEKFKDFND